MCSVAEVNAVQIHSYYILGNYELMKSKASLLYHKFFYDLFL